VTNPLMPDYATLAQVKGYLKIAHDNLDDDLAVWLTGTSRQIDKHCGRSFGQLTTAATVRRTARWNRVRRQWMVDIPDLTEANAADLVVTVAGVTVTQYVLQPDDAPMRDMPYERLLFTSLAERQPCGQPDEVTLSAKWGGWTAPPAGVGGAMRIQCNRLNKRKDSPFGVAGSPQVGGTELRLLERVDPDAANLLKPYLRRWAVR